MVLPAPAINGHQLCAHAQRPEEFANTADGTHEPAGSVRVIPPTDVERLGDAIAELAAHLHAATYRLLELLREFDERQGWGRGFRSCAHWLSWRTGIAPGAAREKVRVARALAVLPQVSGAMRRGALSYAKVRAITRVARPENEERLLEVAPCGTAAHMETIVRAWRRVDRLEELSEERERHARRHLTVHVDDDGSYVVRGRLDPEVGAVLMRAIEAAQRGLFRADRSRDADGPSAIQRRADAIGIVAEAALRNGFGAPGSPGRTTDRTLPPVSARDDASEPACERRHTWGRADRYLVVLHVDAAALSAAGDARAGSSRSSRTAPDPPRGAGQAEVAHAATGGGDAVLDGVRVPAETSRRIACDAGRLIMTHDADGGLLDVGRRTRTVPAAIRRALEHRDRACRFPGCDARFCDAHHIVHWADGGRTRLDNLVLLCRRHHRAVHEERFTIARDAPGVLAFRDPRGREIPPMPAPPVLAEDPVMALCTQHVALGIEPHPLSATPRWNGEALDLDFAILTLREAAAPESAARVAESGTP
ncbi:MAG: HNH endonuclease [Gemmatimonadetes bacterium]|nr:HNH endonuclease [Gemmatimonadota bacterium]